MNSPLAHIPLEQVSEAHLQRLIDNKVIELKTLEYKRDLPGPKDSDHIKFLADVSSFANAVGGHLIYGIGQDKSGAPVPPIGFPLQSPDATIRHMEQMVRDGIRRRNRPQRDLTFGARSLWLRYHHSNPEKLAPTLHGHA